MAAVLINIYLNFIFQKASRPKAKTGNDAMERMRVNVDAPLFDPKG